jgi:hypothetical protein
LVTATALRSIWIRSVLDPLDLDPLDPGSARSWIRSIPDPLDPG